MSIDRAIARGALVLVLCSCSSSAEPAAEGSCASQTSAAALPSGAGHVAFERDVLPIFIASCSFSACHGATGGTNNGVFLGSRASPNDAAAIRAALVDRPSSTAPSFAYVTPFDPQASFLMRKLRGDFCGVDDCERGNCGERMPRGSPALDPKSLSTVETWITQGASQN